MESAPGLEVISGGGAASFVPEPYRIERVQWESGDVFRWLLIPQSGPGVRFEPGQFVMLYGFGLGEVPISISGDPMEPSALHLTIRAAGSVTGAFARLRRGAIVGVRGPFGRPWPLAEAQGQDLVLVAGGIGLAPLRPVICTVLRSRAKFGRVFLLYGARSPADLIFRSDWSAWKRSLEALVTVDHPGGEAETFDPGESIVRRRRGRQSIWRGHVGVVTTLFPFVTLAPERTCAFVCGPEVMMRHAIQELLRRGVRAEKIFLSLERNMKCAVGWCGHCQLGPILICRDGPVVSYQTIAPWLFVAEL